MTKTLKITFPQPLVYWKLTTYDLSITPVRVYAESTKSLWVESHDKRHPTEIKAVVKRSAHMYPSWEEARTALVEMLDRKIRQHEREALRQRLLAVQHRHNLHDAANLKKPASLTLVPAST